MDSQGIPLLDARAWLSALAVWALCWSLGGLPLIGWRGVRGLDRVLLRAALGAPLVALAFMLIGRIPGAMFAFPWRALVPIAIGIELAFKIYVRRQKPKAPDPTETSDPGAREPLNALGLLGAGVAALLLLLALGPALSPPLNYDVLEYHLAVIPHWFRQREFTPIPHVFYSAQPLGMESLYGLAAAIEGVPRGLSSGLVQWLTFLLSALLLNSAARAWGVPRSAAPWLAALFMCHPILFKLQLDRLTDIAGAAFALAGARLAADDSLSRKRAAALLGLLAGGAIATKWTNAATAALPLMAFVLLRAFERRPSGTLRPLAADLIRFAASAAAIIIPWSLYLWIRTGNPLRPFAAGLFKTETWLPDNLHYLMETHGAVTPLQADYWLNLGQRLTSFTTGPPLLILTLLILLAARPLASRDEGAPRAPRSAALALCVALAAMIAFLAWGRLKAAEPRFLSPIYALSILAFGSALASLRAYLPERSRNWIALAPLALVLLYAPRQIAMLRAAPYTDRILGRVSEAEFLKWGLGSATIEFFDAVNRLGPDARPLALGEARAYYFRNPVTVSSVFDENPINSLIAAPGHGGFTHLIVNEFEAARLIDFHPPPALAGDPALESLRGQGPSTYAAISRGYIAWFGAGPASLDSDAQRRRAEFLLDLRRQSAWISPANHRPPAMWIAPLDPPTP